MKQIILTLLTVGLMSCADTETRDILLNNPDTDTDTSCTISGNTISCPDGTQVDVNQDQVNLTEVSVKGNSCTKIIEGLWVESIQNSTIFDVYLNENCTDSQGEYCDNVKPSYGSSGQFGENKRGNGTVCTFDKAFLFGEKVGNDLNIKLLEVL